MDYNINCKQRGKSDSVANFPALSNPTDAQNVSYLRLCDRIFARKIMLHMGWVLSICSCQYLYSKCNEMKHMCVFLKQT